VPRGQIANIGDTMVNALGYHNTRVATGWRLTHHLVAEQILQRPLTANDTVRFKDGNRTNLEPDNIEVLKKHTGSLRRRKAILEAKIEDLQAQLDEVNKEIAERGQRS